MAGSTYILVDLPRGIESCNVLRALSCCHLYAEEDARKEVHGEECYEGQPRDLKYCRPKVDYTEILDSPEQGT